MPAKKSNYKELFNRFPKNPIITSQDLAYTANTVFNPAAALVNGETILLLRVEDTRGISHLTVARSKNGYTDWVIDKEPTFEADPENYPEEKWGIEDPRVTYMEELGQWAVTYTAYSEGGPLVSLAMTKDFKTFDRLGPIMPPEDKDAALFPRKINDRYLLLHRPMSICGSSTGVHIWISESPDLKYWGEHQILLKARQGGYWDANKIGLSPQPLETEEGWLILYHGVKHTVNGAIYRLGIALLDLNNPTKVLNRGDSWVFSPSEEYEREGDVDDVVFPGGWIYDKSTDEVRLYYGGADTCIALATAKLQDLLNYVKQCPEG